MESFSIGTLYPKLITDYKRVRDAQTFDWSCVLHVVDALTGTLTSVDNRNLDNRDLTVTVGRYPAVLFSVLPVMRWELVCISGLGVD